jgi:Peptidase S24-like
VPRFAFRRILVVISVALAALRATAGLADENWIRGIYTGLTPRAVELPEHEAWRRATDLAARSEGSFAVVGTGRSMLPLYQPGTILVLAPCDFVALRRGQTAVYRNERQRLVAHVLIAKARDGWRVSGLNTRWHDMEPLVEEKLFGVVVAAFKPAQAAGTVQLAARRAQTAAFLVD